MSFTSPRACPAEALAKADRVRQSRVVLAPVAGVKFAKGEGAQPGRPSPSIRWRRWQDEFVAGEQLYYLIRPVIGWPQGWRWRATASGGW